MAALVTKPITDHYRAAFEGMPAEAQHAWLTPIREAALSRFVELGFPTTRHEDWRFTNIAPLAEIEFQAPGDSGPPVKSDDLEGTYLSRRKHDSAGIIDRRSPIRLSRVDPNHASTGREVPALSPRRGAYFDCAWLAGGFWNRTVTPIEV